MDNVRKGKEYEQLVSKVFDLFNLSKNYQTIERNVRLNTDHGSAEIDILLTQPSKYFDIKLAVECKDHKTKVGVGVVREFESKLRDIKAHKGIIVSRSGFSSNAISKAKKCDISLLKVDDIDPRVLGLEREIPVLLKQFRIKNRGEGTNFNFELEENQSSNFEIGKLEVNDKSIFKWIREKWDSHQFNLNSDSNRVVFDFSYLDEKYTRDKYGNKVLLENFTIDVLFEIKYFFGLIPLTEKGYLLSEQEKTNTEIVFPFNELPDFKPKLRVITKKEASDLEHVSVFGIVQSLP